MITFTLIIYFITSLVIASRNYTSFFVKGESPLRKNPLYMKKKESLINGFMTIPKILIVVSFAVTLIIALPIMFIKIFGWFLINMP